MAAGLSCPRCPLYFYFYYQGGGVILCVGQHRALLLAASGCRLACFLLMKLHFPSQSTRRNLLVIGSCKSPTETRDLETAQTAGSFTLGYLTSQQTTSLSKVCPWNLLLCLTSLCPFQTWEQTELVAVYNFQITAFVSVKRSILTHKPNWQDYAWSNYIKITTGILIFFKLL